MNGIAAGSPFAHPRGHCCGPIAAPSGNCAENFAMRPSGFAVNVSFRLGTRRSKPALLGAADLRTLREGVPREAGKGETTMQQNDTITLTATVSNPPISRMSRNNRRYVKFGIAVRREDSMMLHYNVIAFGRPASFAKTLEKGNHIKIHASALSQPDNDATIPLLTATFVRALTKKQTQEAGA